MKTLRSRRVALAGALLALAPLHAASAGSSGDPDVRDAAGDANFVSVTKNDASPSGVSAAPFDVKKAWFEGNGTIKLELAAPPPAVGTFAVNFDTPGCTYPADASPVPGVTPPDVPVIDQHRARGVAVVLDQKPPLYSSAYYLCNAPGTTWPLTMIVYRVTGNVITFTIPTTGALRRGAPVIAPYAYTALGFSFVDITPPGRNSAV